MRRDACGLCTGSALRAGGEESEVTPRLAAGRISGGHRTVAYGLCCSICIKSNRRNCTESDQANQ